MLKLFKRWFRKKALSEVAHPQQKGHKSILEPALESRIICCHGGSLVQHEKIVVCDYPKARDPKDLKRIQKLKKSYPACGSVWHHGCVEKYGKGSCCDCWINFHSPNSQPLFW